MMTTPWSSSFSTTVLNLKRMKKNLVDNYSAKQNPVNQKNINTQHKALLKSQMAFLQKVIGRQ